MPVVDEGSDAETELADEEMDVGGSADEFEDNRKVMEKSESKPVDEAVKDEGRDKDVGKRDDEVAEKSEPVV